MLVFEFSAQEHHCDVFDGDQSSGGPDAAQFVDDSVYLDVGYIEQLGRDVIVHRMDALSRKGAAR